MRKIYSYVKLYLNGLYCRLFGKVTYRVRFINALDPHATPFRFRYRYINTATGQESEPTTFGYDIKLRYISKEDSIS